MAESKLEQPIRRSERVVKPSQKSLYERQNQPQSLTQKSADAFESSNSSDASLGSIDSLCDSPSIALSLDYKPEKRHIANMRNSSSSADSNMTGRPRRGAAPRETPVSATVSRSSSGSPVDHKKSLRLTVKAPSSKLREATSHDPADELPRTARAGRPKKPIIDESELEDDEDEDEDEDDADGEEEDDAEGEEEDEMEVDAEGSEDDDDDDPVSSAPGPARPVISRTGPASNPKVTVTPAPTRHQPAPVETKQVSLAAQRAVSPSATATSDEELSELDDEDAEGEDDELDAEGEEEDAEGEELEEEEDVEMGSDDDDEDTGQGTPDLSKMTKRQRERAAGLNDDGAFLQLPMEPQIKKILTAEEHAMRRAEMARRRKNLSEQRNEEEKRETINRLLKKQAPKRRGKVSRREEADGGGEEDEMDVVVEDKPPAGFTRMIMNRDGIRLAMPVEWEGKQVAGILNQSPWPGKVQVVDS